MENWRDKNLVIQFFLAWNYFEYDMLEQAGMPAAGGMRPDAVERNFNKEEAIDHAVAMDAQPDLLPSPKKERIRTKFPETWLWNEGFTE